MAKFLEDIEPTKEVPKAAPQADDPDFSALFRKPGEERRPQPEMPTERTNTMAGRLSREGYVVGAGAVKGFAHAVEHAVDHPLETTGKLAGAAALGLVLSRPVVGRAFGAPIHLVGASAVAGILNSEGVKGSLNTMQDVWTNPLIDLEASKNKFGSQFGPLAVDLAMMYPTTKLGALAGDSLFVRRVAAEAPTVVAKPGRDLPDVRRPLVADSVAGKKVLDADVIGPKYRADLDQLNTLPRTVEVTPSMTMDDVAVRLLNERAAFTGERVTPKVIADEVARLQKLNNIEDASSLPPSILAYDKASIEQLAEKTVFKFVPQIGQFFKSKGLMTEQQVEAVFAHQQTLPAAGRPYFGELAVQQGFVTQPQVDAAMAEQNALKDALAKLRNEMFSVQ